ncbi:galactosylceramide sulfotransferase-like, partial [Tropilaelaps mercedesae]
LIPSDLNYGICRWEINKTSFRGGGTCEQCCRPVNNICLLKTHKCASSTIQNIIMRYGDRRNLSFVLPKEGNYLGHPKLFSKTLLPLELVPAFGFNVLAHHTRFDASAIKEVMPPDTAFITILRDPAELFNSMYAYFGLQNYTGATLQQFSNDPDRQSFLQTNRYEQRFGPNQMFFDLGYDTNRMNDSAISDAIERVDREFDLVLITEYFNESLVLLKNLFCWDTQDVMYFKHNKRKYEDRIPRDVRERLLRYNAADTRLYAHFKSKLEALIVAFGRDRMREEVANLRLWKRLIYDHCVERMGESEQPETRAYSNNVFSIVLRRDVQVPVAVSVASGRLPIDSNDGKVNGVVTTVHHTEETRMCADMARAELPYTERLRAKQRLLAKSAQML